MKIVSWNCNGKFRDKFNKIKELDADIYVIQECENPEYTKNQPYIEFAAGAFWTGESNSKGLGIFFKNPIGATKNDWQDYGLINYLPINVGGKFNLLGVWACKPYIESYSVYQNIHIEDYKENDIIIIGDFNSNSIWDSKHGSRCHGAVVNKLDSIGIYSVYHCITGEEQGKESQMTFYMHRNKSKGYHIDYCFTNMDNIKSFCILDRDTWLKYSDHIPIVVEF